MATAKKSQPKLTLGPNFFHWPAEKKRDFYFRIAYEADVDVVYVGEVVCSKREPFFQPYISEVISRLRSAGKEVVLSTLAMVTTEREIEIVKEYVEAGFIVEANDVACIQAVSGRPHVVGPFITIVNEGSRDYLIKKGAIRVVLPVEMSAKSIKKVTKNSAKTETEVQVFGRLPLSVSMRCYSARAHGLNKDKCRFSCENYPDGLQTDTLDGQNLFAVNGTQVMSHGFGVLLDDLADLRQNGVTHFRLSPHDMDMVKVSSIYRGVLNQKASPSEALDRLRKLTGSIPYINGFTHAKEGMTWVE